jgi:hypothetical protein
VDHVSLYYAASHIDDRIRNKSASFSPIMIAAAIVLPETTVGMIEA